MIMKNLARGSVIFGLVALIGFLFYFQSTAIADDTRRIANDSKGNIQLEEIQEENNNKINTQQNNQENITESILKNNTNNSVLSEGRSFRATAYCLRGKTATGGSVRRGIVAADRRVLPLGTRIKLSAGTYSGAYTVTDTGGAVKGRKIDIWMPSCSEAKRFGSRTVLVSVLGRK
jgi:3D (Asp-Asp-Asp) domain-containing protein